MEIGGVILGAGMELHLAQGDYLYGRDQFRFTIHRMIETRTEQDDDWIVLDGYQHPNAIGPWLPRRVQVRVAALKRSLTLRPS